jgi:hypothetical protein
LVIEADSRGHARHKRSYTSAARLAIRERQTSVFKFDGGLLSSDGCILMLLCEVEQRLRLAGCVDILARLIRSRTAWLISFVFGF